MDRKLCVALAAVVTLSGEPSQKSGIDLSALDRNCKPCEDFWRFANGSWMDRNPIPARYSSWGSIYLIREGNKERLRAILEAAALAKAAPGSDEFKIGAMYSACMDTASLDGLGLKPVQADLDLVNRISSTRDVAHAIGAFDASFPAGPFSAASMQDKKNSESVVLHIAAGGLSLPDRDYYFRDDDRTKGIRAEFLKHVAAMMVLLGDDTASAEAAAKTVLEFETALAGSRLTNVQRRDPYATYHPMTMEALAQLVPGFDWAAHVKRLGVTDTSTVVVMEPEFLKQVQRRFTESPIATWKTWLRWRVIRGAASELSKPFVDEDFRFQQTVLQGTKEQLPRWQTCVNMVDASLGEALGRAYVQKHFPPEAKRRMLELVENLRATLREDLSTSDFLTAETRKNAVAKLNAFAAKIGYPDKWRDYSAVRIIPGQYFAGVRAASAADRRRDMSQIGQPVDRTEWGMTPPTVNAYYSPLKNEIAFPAGILQPPLFDLDADDAANYGAIGAVIGHEMGHGFDDKGSQYAADGNLKDWWADEDRKKFEARTQCIVEQFDTLDAGEGLRHKGKLVSGEALGDLGGLMLAYRAYHRSLKGKEAPVLDGFTADQRFFLAFGRLWGTQYRPEVMRLRLNTDPHPLSKFRANATLQNVPEFHRAFQCKLGDPMVRPPEKQCRLW